MTPPPDDVEALREQLAGAGSWSWDTETNDVVWSPGMWRVMGLDPALPADFELFLSLVPEPYRTESLHMTQRALAAGEPYSLEIPMRRPDGTEIRLRCAGAMTNDGRTVVGSIVDVTPSMQDSLHRTFAEVEARLSDPARLEAVKSTLKRPVPEIVHVLVRALAAQIDAAFAAVTIVDDTHQHFLSTNQGHRESCEIGSTKCQYVIATGDMVAINNVKDHGFFKRLMQSWIHPGQELIAYLGVPLTDADGEVLGAVCVVDDKPREWTAEEHYALYETSQLIRKVLIEAAERAGA